MSRNDFQDALDITVRALDQLERKVEFSARRACRTALVQLAPKHMTLPTPALGLMAFNTEETIPLPSRTVFRSLESLLPDGELRLALASSHTMLHPWSVSEARWLKPTENSPQEKSTGQGHLSGFLVTLQRSSDSSTSPGWFSLHVEGGELLRWALEQVLVFCDNSPLPSRAWDLADHGPNDIPLGLSFTRDGLTALGRNLLLVRLPQHVCGSEKIQLVCRFRDAIPQDETTRDCRVTTNVFPVWNSLESKYPALGAVEQAVSATVHRRIHPMTTEDLGTSWCLWHLTQVTGSGGLQIPEARPPQNSGENSENRSFSFALVNGMASSQPTDPFVTTDLVPAIVLSDLARSDLDCQGQHLKADFLATQGSLANGIPPGSEFQILPTFSPMHAGRINGRLVGTTWGGSDGYLNTVAEDSEMGDVIALVRYGSEPMIQDVLQLLRRNFGHTLELVDERDLLGWSSGPLSIRFRFLRNNQPAGERAAIQEALHAFLSRQMQGFLPQGFQLLPVESKEESHVRAG